MLIVLLAIVVLLAPFQSSYAISLSPGEAAPDFNLSTAEGKGISLSRYKGQIIVIIYWRADQDRSVSALQDGVDLFKAFKDKGVQVLTLVAGTESLAEVRKVVSDNKIDLPVLIDSGRHVYGDYGIRVYPTTVIIGRDGKMAYGIPGYALTYRITVEGYLRYMLGEIDSAQMEETISMRTEKKEKESIHEVRNYNLALKLIENGLIYEAKTAVIKLIEDDPGNEDFHTLLGFIYLQTKDADDAFREFRKALEINPVSKEAKTGLGKALILQGYIDSAIDALSDATVANPYSELAYYELGRAYELKGESSKSLEMYKKVLEKIFDSRVLPQSITECK